ncbi:hypothetical protein [Cardinium endosymbiont of Nabis limbatus]|uniref:hypothetical protein n=1 Tax=Cardinium endosymbiont of Nabis limbatus TaxID=3066217 RepID=UPI003AF3446B
MIYFNVSVCILAIFLLLTLVIGIYFSRKKPTFRAYAVGNKQFSTATMVATVLATAYSGGGGNAQCRPGSSIWTVLDYPLNFRRSRFVGCQLASTIYEAIYAPSFHGRNDR